MNEEKGCSTRPRSPLLERYADLLRVRQYAKNFFIFAPLFFGLKMTDVVLLARTVEAFIAFSLIASAVYIFNDYHDIEEDRRHPGKRDRPLASGTISVRNAAILGILLLVAGLMIALWCGWGMLSLVSVYIVLNVAYTLRWKHVSIIDIVIIAIGFVIRIFVGAAVTGIVLYPWLIIVTFLLALFLALAKRNSDLHIHLQEGNTPRTPVDGYTVHMLDYSMIIILSVLLVSYIMYTLSPEVMARMHSDKLYVTTVFVVLGCLRYLQITFVEKRSGSPTDILWDDRFIQCTLLAWITTFAYLIYR